MKLVFSDRVVVVRMNWLIDVIPKFMEAMDFITEYTIYLQEYTNTEV